MPVIALYKPEIPPNTGNIGRLCVATNTRLCLVGKTGFSLDDAAVKRAGLDYWDNLSLEIFPRMKDLIRAHSTQRIISVTKEGKYSHWDFPFERDDVLLFGSESKGLPPAAMKLCDETVKIPMWGPVRSLNLANSVAIVLYEALRKNRNELSAEASYRRGYYKKV